MKDNNTEQVHVIAKKKSVAMKTDGVSMGGKFACDRPECNHFATNDFNKFESRIADHPVKSGITQCKECDKTVDIKTMKNKPTMSDVKAKLVFHEKCENEFFERRGFKKQ